MRRAALLAAAIVTVAATPAPNATPPPQIYHVVTRPLCAELHEHIRPAIGMMLQNDTTIKKSPDLFKAYNSAALNGTDPGVTALAGPLSSETTTPGTMNPAENMALLGMEQLIRPLANNVIAIQTMLDSPALRTGTGRPEDDKRLREIRAKLLQALAAQNASLDIISGFVDTQQMADLQHSGEEYISSMSQPETTNGGTATPRPDPLTSNPNYAGLPPNPFTIDLATIPGLTLGYNPVTRLLQALNWTMERTAADENDAANAVMNSAALCSGSIPLASPAP